MSILKFDKVNVFIDFEYNSLDRDHSPSDIIQSKFVITDGEFNVIDSYIENHYTDKTISASAVVVCGISPHFHKDSKLSSFSSEKFFDIVCKTLVRNGIKTLPNFYGFGIETDIKLLDRFTPDHIEPLGSGMINSDIVFDLSDLARLSKFEEQIALEGSSLEAVHYILTGEVVKKEKTHNGLEEFQCFIGIAKALNGLEINDYLSFVPWGDQAGIPIKNFIEDNRRRADGIRYNTSSIFSNALNHFIYELEYDEEQDF